MDKRGKAVEVESFGTLLHPFASTDFGDFAICYRGSLCRYSGHNIDSCGACGAFNHYLTHSRSDASGIPGPLRKTVEVRISGGASAAPVRFVGSVAGIGAKTRFKTRANSNT